MADIRNQKLEDYVKQLIHEELDPDTNHEGSARDRERQNYKKQSVAG